MSLATRVPSNVDTAGFLPELWSAQVIDAMQNELVCWDAFDTGRWRSGLKKGDKLYVGMTTHITALEVVIGTIGSAASASKDITSGQTAKYITIDQWYEAPHDVDEMTAMQSQLDWPGNIRKEQAYAIAKNMDTYINALFSTLGGSSVKGTDGVAIDDDLLMDITETLNEADVPKSDRSLIIDPSGLRDLMSFDKFISAQYTNIGAVNSGVIGNSPIYGAMVRVTNNLTAATTGAYAVLAHKQAIAGIKQMQTAWMEEHKTYHITRYNQEVLYGASEFRDDFGVPFYTRKK